MPLPNRIDYSVPSVDGFVNRAGWRLEAHRSVLLVHDMQRYFVRPFSPTCPAYVGAVAATRRLVATARRRGIPVVYTAQPGDQRPAERGVMCEVWGPGIRDRVEDTAVIAELAPAPGERVQVKHRYSAFVRSDLERWMREQGRDQVALTGIYAHIGVLATATDAFMRDLQPFLIGDAVADFGAEQHHQAMAVASGLGGVVLDADQARASLAGVPTGASA